MFDPQQLAFDPKIPELLIPRNFNIARAGVCRTPTLVLPFANAKYSTLVTKEHTPSTLDV